MSGLFAVEADVIEPVLPEIRPTGYKVLLELLARAPIEPEEIVDIGYTFDMRSRGASKLGPVQYVQYVQHLVRLTVPARRRPTVERAPAGVSEEP
jgi:dolichol-phosphate mannosyltransferase